MPLDVLTYDRLSERLYTLFAKKTDVSLKENPYIINYFKNKKYSSTGKYGVGYKIENNKLLLSDKEVNKITLELQDVYIANPEMPSYVGALTKANFKEIVDWALWLKILRSETFSLTPLGRLLKCGLKDDLFMNQNIDENPFVIDDLLKIIYFYLLINCDGDVLFRFYNKIDKISTFNRSEAGEILFSVLKEIHNDFKNVAIFSNEVQKLQTLKGIIHSLQDQILGKKITYGGCGIKENRVSTRLEPFVDLSILSKNNQDKFYYRYKINEYTKRFSKICDNIGTNEGVEDFLNGRFFESMNYIYELNGERIKDYEEILNFIIVGYISMKNPLGLAPIEETAVLSSTSALVNKKKYFEVEQIMKDLKEIVKIYPRQIRINVDKSGKIRYLKIDDKFIRERTK